jgi:hypothetical protein
VSVTGLDRAPPGVLPFASKFGPGPFSGRAQRAEHLMGHPQLLARFSPPALAPQPLAVQQVGTGQMHHGAGLPQVSDGRSVQFVDVGRGGQERADPGLDTESERGSAGQRRA